MVMTNKKIIINKKISINLFNCGKLKIKDAEFYEKLGYDLIIHNGIVIDLVKGD